MNILIGNLAFGIKARLMDIQESIKTVLSMRTLFGKFVYDALFERHPELKRVFEGVDIDQQAVLLTMQLMAIGQCYPQTLPAADAYLQILGAKHKRRGIPRDSYLPFREVLIETLEQCLGPFWDENLAAQWPGALNAATEKMFEAYEQDSRV